MTHCVHSTPKEEDLLSRTNKHNIKVDIKWQINKNKNKLKNVTDEYLVAADAGLMILTYFSNKNLCYILFPKPVPSSFAFTMYLYMYICTHVYLYVHSHYVL